MLPFRILRILETQRILFRLVSACLSNGLKALWMPLLGNANLALCRSRYAGRNLLAVSTSVMLANLISFTRRSWSVLKHLSTRPLACGMEVEIVSYPLLDSASHVNWHPSELVHQSVLFWGVLDVGRGIVSYG